MYYRPTRTPWVLRARESGLKACLDQVLVVLLVSSCKLSGSSPYFNEGPYSKDASILGSSC